ncbi:MAG: hypothetical protein QOJ65_1050 [Fimbriimonadaceae bacterium]|jgi:uncharacterized membrane protein|nr:hypothetical protein [Fimbriimonadaceae bacterium]
MVNLRQRLMRHRIGKVVRNNPELADVLERNIETILDLRRQALANRRTQDRVADAITNFAGSMVFLYVHVVWFGVWIAVNLGWIGHARQFDPFPFGLLTMIVSLEAIFLSTLVMISQNRQADQADERADLDLQIDMLGEYEITKILQIVTGIGKKLDVAGCDDDEIKELEKTVLPAEVLREIQERKRLAADE